MSLLTRLFTSRDIQSPAESSVREVPVTIDDVAWSMFGKALRDQVHDRAYEFFRVRLEKPGDPRSKVDQSTRFRQYDIVNGFDSLSGLIEESYRIFGKAKSDGEWPYALVETTMTIEACTMGGGCWVPIARLLTGTSNEWEAIQLVFPEEGSNGKRSRKTQPVRRHDAHRGAGDSRRRDRRARKASRKLDR